MFHEGRIPLPASASAFAPPAAVFHAVLVYPARIFALWNARSGSPLSHTVSVCTAYSANSAITTPTSQIPLPVANCKTVS